MQECRHGGRHEMRRNAKSLSCDGVGSLIVAVDQGAEGVDQVFDLGLLQPEEIVLPGDLVQLGHGLFVGDAIGVHSSPRSAMYWAKFSIGPDWKYRRYPRSSTLKYWVWPLKQFAVPECV